MNTRDIRTSHAVSVCDVCGRTLLRGERADVYLNGGTRRSVCELCKTRALHEGWVREGTVPAYEGGENGGDRRRSLLGRRRRRPKDAQGQDIAPTLADDLDAQAWSQSDGIELGPVDDEPPLPPSPLPPAPAPRRRARAPRERAPREDAPISRGPREPRHVHAVPSGTGQKMIAAADLFNNSEHRRTVSGVARSLGVPTVAILPLANRPSLVHVIVSWELCWYRYEVDLGDDAPTVREDGRGYELAELSAAEKQPNAAVDDAGALTVAGQ